MTVTFTERFRRSYQGAPASARRTFDNQLAHLHDELRRHHCSPRYTTRRATSGKPGSMGGGESFWASFLTRSNQTRHGSHGHWARAPTRCRRVQAPPGGGSGRSLPPDRLRLSLRPGSPCPRAPRTGSPPHIERSFQGRAVTQAGLRDAPHCGSLATAWVLRSPVFDVRPTAHHTIPDIPYSHAFDSMSCAVDTLRPLG
jgi:hypothetical protein